MSNKPPATANSGFLAGLRIRPLFKCVGCGKKHEGAVESVELPHIFTEPDGWFRVWRGYGGWEWSCGCVTKGRERNV
jgi:hypothetical protein